MKKNIRNSNVHQAHQVILTDAEWDNLKEFREKQSKNAKLSEDSINKAADYFDKHYNGRTIMTYYSSVDSDNVMRTDYDIRKIDITKTDFKKALRRGDISAFPSHNIELIEIKAENDKVVTLKDFGEANLSSSWLSYYLPNFYNPYIPIDFYVSHGLWKDSKDIATKDQPVRECWFVNDEKMKLLRKNAKQLHDLEWNESAIKYSSLDIVSKIHKIL